MKNNSNAVGVYTIHAVDTETGEMNKVFEGTNHLTPQFLAILASQGLGKFANFVHYRDFCDRGAVHCKSGLVSEYVRAGDSYGDMHMLKNAFTIYGLSDIAQGNEVKYPFTNNKLEIDTTKIVFVGDDTRADDANATEKHAYKIPQPFIDHTEHNAFSRSWRLGAGKGLGSIKTICVGRSLHTLGPSVYNLTTNLDNNPPFIIKNIISGDKIDGVNVIYNTVTIMEQNGEMIAILGRGNVNHTIYNFTTEKFTAIPMAHPLKNTRLNTSGKNSFVHNGELYFTDTTTYLGVSKINLSTLEVTRLGGYDTDFNINGNIFKKGNVIFALTSYGGNVYTEFKTSDTKQIRAINIETGARDSTLFGAYNKTLPALLTENIIGNLPAWFKHTSTDTRYYGGNLEIGTRNDNENWLLLDTQKGIVMECTDLADVQGSMVNWYFSPTLANITIDGKLYFLTDRVYNDVSDSIFTVELEGNGNILGSSYGGLRLVDSDSTAMYSIITNLVDSNGDDIVQTEDTEYIFTVTFKNVN